MRKYTSPYYHLVYCWKYPSSIIELPTRGLSWCVYTSDCPQPVSWSVWTSWVKIKMRWAGLGEDHRKWEGQPLLLYKWVFSASGDILKTLVVVVIQSCPTLCDPMDCSMPILHCLPEFTQDVFIEPVMPSNYLILRHPLLLCPQSFPASGSFPVSQLFVSRGQSIGASPSASVLPLYIQGWFPLRLPGLISLLSKGLSRVFSSRRPWLFHCNLSPWTPHQYCCKQLKVWGRWDSWLTECIRFPQHQRTLVKHHARAMQSRASVPFGRMDMNTAKAGYIYIFFNLKFLLKNLLRASFPRTPCLSSSRWSHSVTANSLRPYRL